MRTVVAHNGRRKALLGHPRRLHRGRAPRSSGTSGGVLDLPALAAKVDPGLVDVDVQLNDPNAHAAGTGIVLDSSGVVLTNNHVISGATSITTTDVGTRAIRGGGDPARSR